MEDDNTAREAVESSHTEERGTNATPAAGPHAKEEQTDRTKTPGAGSLPENGEDSVEPSGG